MKLFQDVEASAFFGGGFDDPTPLAEGKDGQMSNLMYLRGKACKRIINAASLNDAWSMKRYSAINSYLAELVGRGP